MRVVWTELALADLDDILAYTAENCPTLVQSVEGRIRAVVERLATWPRSARATEQRPEVRVVSILRYPYRVFYRVSEGAIEILHIHHTSREPWLD